ncbi:MAG: hypothetical protein HYX67_05185 [Candidatus Melainabacteria bacterium]|nr:hypothetical protein [Candidatus Melainabacteria bacterium]
MTAFLDCLRSFAPSFEWPQSYLPAPETVFKNGIGNFLAGRIDQAGCIEVCMTISKDHLGKVNEDILAACRDLQAKFEQEASLCPVSRKTDVDALRAPFKREFAKLVETAWAKAIANMFQPIPDLGENEQIAAAEHWSKQFLEGVAYCFELSGIQKDDTNASGLVQRIVAAFEEESLLVIEKKLITVLKQMQLNVLGPTLADLEFAKQSAQNNHPEIKDNKELLRNICMKAIEMQLSNETDPSKSSEMFKEVFQTKKEK